MINCGFWNSHQRHKFLRAEASRDILKFRVSDMPFPGVFKGYFPLRMPCCFLRIHKEYMQDWEQCSRNVPGTPRHPTGLRFYRSTPVLICHCHCQCHSKLGNGCFTIIIVFNGAYFLLAVMVEGDESGQLRTAN